MGSQQTKCQCVQAEWTETHISLGYKFTQSKQADNDWVFLDTRTNQRSFKKQNKKAFRLLFWIMPWVIRYNYPPVPLLEATSMPGLFFHSVNIHLFIAHKEVSAVSDDSVPFWPWTVSARHAQSLPLCVWDINIFSISFPESLFPAPDTPEQIDKHLWKGAGIQLVTVGGQLSIIWSKLLTLKWWKQGPERIDSIHLRLAAS